MSVHHLENAPLFVVGGCCLSNTCNVSFNAVVGMSGKEIIAK